MLVIRLTRQGAHKVPFYHINLADRRRACAGRFIEKLGFYNPLAKGEEVYIRVNRERVDYWVDRGALPSETVDNLIKKLKKTGESDELLGREKKHRRTKKKEKEQKEQGEIAAENAKTDSAAGSDTGETPASEGEANEEAPTTSEPVTSSDKKPESEEKVEPTAAASEKPEVAKTEPVKDSAPAGDVDAEAGQQKEEIKASEKPEVAKTEPVKDSAPAGDVDAEAGQQKEEIKASEKPKVAETEPVKDSAPAEDAEAGQQKEKTEKPATSSPADEKEKTK